MSLSKPDTVATQERERLRAKQLEEKPYKADEHELRNFRQMAQEVERKDVLKTRRRANELFEKAVDYKTYRLANHSASCTPYMAGHLLRSKKKVGASISQNSRNGKDLVGVLKFQDSFRRTCNDGGVHKGIGMMLFKYYVKETAWKTMKKSKHRLRVRQVARSSAKRRS